MDIQDKVVLLTGASEGIGLATARLLAQQGAKLAEVARSASPLQQLVSEYQMHSRFQPICAMRQPLEQW